MLLPALYAIVDAQTAAEHNWEVPTLAEAFLAGGARLLQIRGGVAPSGTLQRWTDAVVSKAARYDATVIVNNRADVARIAGAAGVHLGQGDLTVEAVRRQLGPDAIIGLSTHSPTELDTAWGQAVTYVAVGPVYGTVTKTTKYDAVGTALVQLAAAREPSRPVVAIGGVTLDRAPEVIAAGAASVAVIGDLLTGGDPAKRVRDYVEALAK